MTNHEAIINQVEGPYKKQRVGDGVSLILAKESNTPFKYIFNSDKYTYEEAKDYALKLGVDNVIRAKLSMKATNGKPEVDGRIWSSGMHHVYVNDRPARIYVPEETIMQTFGSIKSLIKDQGRMPIGIDHLSESVLGENEILAKMNLLDVGDVTKVGTDGSSIYILDSELKNQQIKDLHADSALPAFSIVGAMDAKPCPNGKADYVVNSIDVERVDFVEAGGCSVCKVGEQPDKLILTSKQVVESKEVDNMVDANEAAPKTEDEVKPDESVVEEPVEEVKDEVKKEEVPEVPDEPEVKEDAEPEADEVVAVEEEVSEIDGLKKEIAELKEMLGGKKPKVAASSSFDIESEITALIKAGKATPAMKEMLTKVAEESEDAFRAMAASMPKFVSMKMESKLAKIEEQTKKAKKKPTWEDEYGELAKAFRV
jgi:hypothetical protein